MTNPQPAQHQPEGDAVPRKRGRRATISREAILKAAIELVNATPSEPVSLNSVARSLSVTPMAIYTYFANRDELMQAMTAALLDNIVIVTPPGASAVDEIRQWSMAMRSYFLDRPRLINMLSWGNGHTSVAWLNQSQALVHALGRMAITERDRAQALLWIWNVVMGAIYAELVDVPGSGIISDEEVARLEPAVCQHVSLIKDLTAMPDHHALFFDFQLERMIDGLEAWISRSSS